METEKLLLLHQGLVCVVSKWNVGCKVNSALSQTAACSVFASSLSQQLLSTQRYRSPSHAHTLEMTQAIYPMGWEGTQETQRRALISIFKCYGKTGIMMRSTNN